MALVFTFALPLTATPPRPHLDGTYIATAYAQHGITASGEYVHRHVVAADPSILPIGTRVKIKHAGRYSGEYVVMDTGDKIEGRRLDIYMPSAAVCKKFGVKRVRVKVIELGNGTQEAAKQADKAVKQDVAQDVQKGVVGNAASQVDWVAQGAPVAAAVKATNAPPAATNAAGATNTPAATTTTAPTGKRKSKKRTKDTSSSSTATTSTSNQN